MEILVKVDLSPSQTNELPENVPSEVDKEVFIDEEHIEEIPEVNFTKSDKLFEQLSEVVKEVKIEAKEEEPEPVQEVEEVVQEEEEEVMCIEKDSSSQEEEEPLVTKKDKKHWKKNWCKKGKWAKKKKWLKAKFDKKFDEAIQNALPQIAVHVAKILRNDGAELPVKALSP